MTIFDYLEGLKKGEYSVTEQVKDRLKKIGKLNPELNAFITVTGDLALAKARKLEQELSASKDLEALLKEKPLFGVPIAHKDIFSTKGVETTAASNILQGYIPEYDATVVRKLDEAGAIMLGKLNCDAFAHGASGENSDFGPAKNPYDKKRTPGGSSSGSAVAVAADMVFAATGTDTGSSLRNPASFTNTVSMKNTYGLVSRFGVIAMSSSLDTVGHITRTVKENAYVLKVVAGYDPYDAITRQGPSLDYLEGIESNVNGLKVGFPKEYIVGGLDPQVKLTMHEVRKRFKKLGAEVMDISLPHTEYAVAVYYILMASEVSSNLARFDGIRFGHGRSKFGEEAQRRIMLGTYSLSAGFYDAYYLKAQKVRTLIIDDFIKAFKKVDVIATPVFPDLPPLLGKNTDDPLKMYLMDVLTAPVNIAGLPALAVPAGFSKEGLPIGIQLIGKHFDEKLLFRVGYSFEQESKGE